MARFTYIYRTSDGNRRTGEIESVTRDEAFAALRAQGIRPIKVFANDGSRENGARRGLRKRTFAVCLTFVAVLVGVVSFLGGQRSKAAAGSQEASVALRPGVRIAKAKPRFQINLASVTNLDSTFKYASERFLVRFAVPGKVASGKVDGIPEDLFDALESDILVYPEDSKAVSDLKGIVAGLKGEVQRYLNAGFPIEDILEFLVSRQKMESEYRRQIRTKAENADVARQQLKSLGLL